MIKKKVYAGSGDYIGKIEEITLGKSKIDCLKIKVDSKVRKKKKIKIRGFIIKYKHVKSVGDVVIIKGKIWEKILR